MTRQEYPRPQFVRDQWINLNGTWQFQFDDKNVGEQEQYFNKETLDKEIQVPFVYQSKLSGIGERTIHEYVWYKKEVVIPKYADKRTILHFGAVDYYCKVYVNGKFVGDHEGGHTSFSFDISNYLLDENQSITVKVYDPIKDETIPRGKQFWEEEPRAIWYTNSTGIWQTVWVEQVNNDYLEKVRFTPDLDRGVVWMDFVLNKEAEISKANYYVKYKISFKNILIAEDRIKMNNLAEKRAVDIIQNKIFRTNFHDSGYTWSPEHPNLFNVSIELCDEKGIVLDKVQSYFGYRKVHTENGMVYLNNKPYYQKLVLDQGYWPEGLLTAPKAEDYKKDIELAKEMGFNGCRKHQKTEDPLFMYYADTLGFLVWGECASAPVYTKEAATRLMKEWMEIVDRDYNHPSIVTWVPLNESWGIPDIHHDKKQQHFSTTMYHMLHAIDGTRLVISNDGWEATVTDICAIHNYGHGNADEKAKYQYFKESISTVDNLLTHSHSKWEVYAENHSHQGEPILLTEFGGIAFKIGEQSGWGYTSVENAEDYITEYRKIMEAIFQSKGLWGYCYTQLTDVEQEINGILTYNRIPKCDLSKINELNNLFFPERLAIKGKVANGGIN